MTGEKSTYDFLIQQQGTQPDGSLLKQADIHDSVYKRFSKEKDYGVRIGDAFGTPAPFGGSGVIKEFDVCFLIVCYARVPGAANSKTERADPRETATNLAHEVIKLFYDDCSLGGRVCRIEAKRILRDWDEADKAQPYAVCNVPVVIDSTGRPLPSPFN